MTKQVINIGRTANDRSGDPLRTAFEKVNANFDELFGIDNTAVIYHLGDDTQFVDIDAESGTVVIQSGFDTGMPVYIKGANCADGGVGGNVVIEAGGAPLPNTGTTGNIEIAAQQTTIDSNNNVWSFRDDGVLELPLGGDIVDSNGDTVLGGTGGGISIGDFGEGFSLTAANKIVTNKLYSTNLTQSTQHYRLELDTNGVVHLPDQSMIMGATLKTVPGNYAALMAGPVGKDEDSQIWVDPDGAWIGTKYNTSQKLWQFDNNGNTLFPNGIKFDGSEGNTFALTSGTVSKIDLRDDGGRGFYTDNGGFIIRGNGTYGWTFGIDGALSFPDNHLTINGSTIGRSTTVDTDVNGSRLTFTDTSTSLETYVDPAGLNNTSYSRVYTNGTEVILKVAQEDIAGETSNSLTVSGNSVDIMLTDGVLSVGWTFSGSDLTLPTGGEIKTAAGTGDVVIEANDGTARTWTFGGDGTLDLPESVSAGNAIIQTTSAINIQVNSNAHNWTFGTDGKITLPNSGTINNTVSIDPPAGTIYTFTVDADGNASGIDNINEIWLPTNGGSIAVQPGWIITFANNSQQTVVSNTAGIMPPHVGQHQLIFTGNITLTSADVWPLTIQSADYTTGITTKSLDLTPDGTKYWSLYDDGITHFPNGLEISSEIQGPFSSNAIIGNTGESSLSLRLTTQNVPGTTKGQTQIFLPGYNELYSNNAPGIEVTVVDNTWTFRKDGILSLPDFGATPSPGTGEPGDICRNGDTLYFKTSAGWAAIGLTLI